MTRHLNTNCNFTSRFLVCDIPSDVIQVVLKMKTKWGKHMLTEDQERRTEKVQTVRKVCPLSPD